MPIIIKTHSTPNGPLIAMCDSDILGKTFEEGDRQLNLDTIFYRGEEKDEDSVEALLKRDAYVVNAVGKESVALLSRLGLITANHIITIAGIPHAQCVIERR
ncbi:DUF424 family protein [Candidatus Woesearchaeota archaeon]|nr:DUF424 family protein [Candidatus Woesearchaeota archaeon]